MQYMISSSASWYFEFFTICISFVICHMGSHLERVSATTALGFQKGWSICHTDQCLAMLLSSSDDLFPILQFFCMKPFFSPISGSVWSSYRKSCVNTVMKWLVPESSSRYINRMTNEALHKGDLYTCLQTHSVS